MKLKTQLLGAATLIVLAGPAYSQDAPIASSQDGASSTTATPVPATPSTRASTGQVEEIVVTAQKRSENLQNVPIAVTAVTSTALEKVGVKGIADLSVAVPGLNATNTYGRLTLSLRGIGSTSVGPGVENPIALYIDGVYYASTTASLLSLNNVAQIEVLKGPQGTLFGRNATGGLVQITTKDPTQTSTANIEGTYANYSTFIGSLYVSGPLTDNLAMDLAVYAKHQGDGWGRQLSTGKDVYDVAHDIAVRSKIVYTPGSETKLTLIGDYNNTRDTMIQSALRPGSISPFIPGPAPDTGYDVRSNYVHPHIIKAAGVSFRADQGLGDLKLSSITAYRDAHSTVSGDIDGTEEQQAQFLFKQFDRQFSEELQLSSGSASKLKWTTGLFYFDGRSGYEPLNLPLYFADVRYVFGHANERTRSGAAFAQASYPVLADTNLTIGGRYTYEKHSTYGGTFGVTSPDLPASTAVQSPVAPQSKTDKEPTWRISLDHRFSPAVLAYLSYNRGFKAGGFSVSSPGAPGYDPEKLDAYEVGLKTNLFDRHVRFNVAGFYYLYNDIQVQRYNAISIETVNGAKAKSYGFDFDLTANIAPGLSFTSGLTYAHATFSKYPGCVLSAPNGGVPLFGGDCTGFDLPIAPRLTTNAALDYTMDFAGGKLNLDGNVYYNSGYVTDISNNIHQDRYAKVGAYLKWTSPSDRFSVRVYGQNLTNRRVIMYGDSQGVGSMLVTYGEPRTYGVTIGYKY